jgi:2,5-diamino-6-(ribosylamino)-4(3H)-pyrimidinone 5'-phosphate reductase
MEPVVILHIAMSLDNRITGFQADIERYYSLASTWDTDAVLVSSSTILDAPTLDVPDDHHEMFNPPGSGETDLRPLMVIVDGKGRIRSWDKLKAWPYMRDVLVLCSTSTPGEYLECLKQQQIKFIITGDTRVDLRDALGVLYREHGVRVVHVDSGGTLNSVLLKNRLVSEISVLIHPCIAGGEPWHTLCDPKKAGIADVRVPLELIHCEITGSGIIWARYAILNE